MTKRYEFGEEKRWIGLHGVESADGIEKIGIITMNPTCAPIGGVIEEPEPEPVIEPEKPVEPVEPVKPVEPVIVKPIEPVVPVEPVTPEEPVKEEDSGNFLLILLIFVGCVFVCMLLVFVGLYFRKRKLQKKLNLIDNSNSNSETNPDKVDWNSANEANQVIK